MQPYQQEFIELALKYRALEFGSFTLKSGRVSPYFFNAGKFTDGEALCLLAGFYADAIQANPNFQFDLIYGPAYKGIQIASGCSIALYQKYHLSYPVSYNRKEIKDHGEGGLIVGAPLAGKRILLTDDVITAGTAIREANRIIQQQGGVLAGIITALDRQEVGKNSRFSANQEIAQEFGVPVVAIIQRDDLIEYAASHAGIIPQQDLISMENYRITYGSIKYA